jgi:hypothetical protein
VSILSLVMLQSGATAQTKSLCSLVTIEDARAFFGGAPEQEIGSPQICAYSLKGQTVKLLVVNYTVSATAKQLFERYCFYSRRRQLVPRFAPRTHRRPRHVTISNSSRAIRPYPRR